MFAETLRAVVPLSVAAMAGRVFDGTFVACMLFLSTLGAGLHFCRRVWLCVVIPTFQSPVFWLWRVCDVRLLQDWQGL